MTRMKNYDTRPSALPFLTYIPAKIPWSVLRGYNAIHEVHPSAKAVPSDRGIGSLGTSIYIFKGEVLNIKEGGGLLRKMMQASRQIYGIDG